MTWYDRAIGEGGGAVDLARLVLGEEDIQGVQFDVVMGPSLQPDTLPQLGTPGSYFGTPASWSPPGGAPPVLLWDINADSGIDSFDLQEIILFSNTTTASERLQPGESGSFELGYFHLNLLDDTADTFVSLTPNGANPWSIWDFGTLTPQPASTFNVGGPFVITAVPEPGTILLAIAALLALLSTTRRSF